MRNEGKCETTKPKKLRRKINAKCFKGVWESNSKSCWFRRSHKLKTATPLPSGDSRSFLTRPRTKKLAKYATEAVPREPFYRLVNKTLSARECFIKKSKRSSTESDLLSACKISHPPLLPRPHKCMLSVWRERSKEKIRSPTFISLIFCLKFKTPNLIARHLSKWKPAYLPVSQTQSG